MRLVPLSTSIFPAITAITAAILLAAYPAQAQVQWATNVGGNNHYYLAVNSPSGINWTSANSAATTSGGYLATLTSKAENDFVYGLIDNPVFWQFDGFNTQGPHIGGIQVGGPEPAGGFQWVTGEAWNYTNWAANQPDNNAGNEGFVQFFGTGNNRANSWNDVSATAAFSRGYVVEFDTNPNATPSAAPEPGSLALLLPIAGVAGMLIRNRRKK